MKNRSGKNRMILLAALLIAVAAMVYVPGKPAKTEDTDSRIRTIVDDMSVRQKITQCIMVDFSTWDDGSGKEYEMTALDPEVAELLSKYQFGSVNLFAENIRKTDETLALVKDMQSAVIEGGGLPMIVATDQEGGIVCRLVSGTGLPGNMALAAAGDPENAEIAGRIIGSELAALGINTALAPVIDVNSSADNPVIGVRSFGDDADIVGEYGCRFIKGLNENHIIGCAKHFPGHGNTSEDSHYDLPVVDRSLNELMQCDLRPFQIAIDQGAEMIMTAHILYPKIDDTKITSEKTGKEESRPATLSYRILTELLRDELGFEGVIMTDSMVMGGIADAYDADQAVLEAFKAGADIVTMPVSKRQEDKDDPSYRPYNKETWTGDMEKILTRVEAAVRNGELSEDRLDGSVIRILELKEKKGILDHNADDDTAEKAREIEGCREHRALEREIAAKAVTVVRNDHDALPLQTDEKTAVLLLAPYESEKPHLETGVRRAMAAGLVPDTAEVRSYVFSEEDYAVSGDLKNAIDRADVVITCSELYDTDAMAYESWDSLGPKGITEYCRDHDKTSVVMSLNFPYDTQLYPDADAVVAVYGWSGPNIAAGVEVMFGVYGATGKLPVSIPAFDIEQKAYTDEVLYERGYGLSYAGAVTIQKEETEPSKK